MLFESISCSHFDQLLVLNLLRTNENSWPFLEPVTEELAPNYFSIIEVRPLKIIRIFCFNNSIESSRVQSTYQ